MKSFFCTFNKEVYLNIFYMCTYKYIHLKACTKA